MTTPHDAPARGDDPVTTVERAWGYRAECSCGWKAEEIEDNRPFAEDAAEWHRNHEHGEPAAPGVGE